jgi:hypothetical protein
MLGGHVQRIPASAVQVVGHFLVHFHLAVLQVRPMSLGLRDAVNALYIDEYVTSRHESWIY